jgi:hypothetical protein
MKLTPELIDAMIDETEYLESTVAPTLTVCVLKLKNGCVVIGESNVIMPENFNQEMGRAVAFSNAKEKIWGLEGYAIKRAMKS